MAEIFEAQGGIIINPFVGIIASLLIFFVGAWIIRLLMGRKKQLKVETERDLSIINTIGCLALILVFLSFFIVNNYFN